MQLPGPDLPGLSMGIPWKMSHGMEWDCTHCISHGTVVEKLPELTELSLSETVDKQEIENLLNEHSDSECECQYDNEL